MSEILIVNENYKKKKILTEIFEINLRRQNKVAHALCGFFQKIRFGMNCVNTSYTLV